MLVMTATPIPRSLAWAIYGELDVSVLDEKPPGRAEIVTRVRDEEGREKVYRFAGERVAAGERVYVVVPAIEEGEREVAATRETAERIAAVAARRSRSAILHGRMPPAERAAVLRDFASGRVPILVSTTVVEVGVDVPEATFMIVENAEVFGLAQLHQLRGRVGRSARRVVVRADRRPRRHPEARAAAGRPRVHVATGSSSPRRTSRRGGPATCSGRRQSGLPAMRVADPIRDLAGPRPGAARGRRARARAGRAIRSDLFGYP